MGYLNLNALNFKNSPGLYRLITFVQIHLYAV